MSRLDEARRLLGRPVVVRLTDDDRAVARGQLLAVDEGGEVVLRDEMGLVHWCWPMLDIADDSPRELSGEMLRPSELFPSVLTAARAYVAARMEAEGADSAASRLDAVRKVDYAWFDLVKACGYDPPGHEEQEDT